MRVAVLGAGHGGLATASIEGNSIRYLSEAV
jgi:hypothetical protein